jgi:hypothetical protein
MSKSYYTDILYPLPLLYLTASLAASFFLAVSAASPIFRYASANSASELALINVVLYALSLAD